MSENEILRDLNNEEWVFNLKNLVPNTDRNIKINDTFDLKFDYDKLRKKNAKATLYYIINITENNTTILWFAKPLFEENGEMYYLIFLKR